MIEAQAGGDPTFTKLWTNRRPRRRLPRVAMPRTPVSNEPSWAALLNFIRISRLFSPCCSFFSPLRTQRLEFRQDSSFLSPYTVGNTPFPISSLSPCSRHSFLLLQLSWPSRRPFIHYPKTSSTGAAQAVMAEAAGCLRPGLDATPPRRATTRRHYATRRTTRSPTWARTTARS